MPEAEYVRAELLFSSSRFALMNETFATSDGEVVRLLEGEDRGAGEAVEDDGVVQGQLGDLREVLAAIADGRRPEGMADDEDTLYTFCDELHRMQSIRAATYARAVKTFDLSAASA